jgi:hypothetical protein
MVGLLSMFGQQVDPNRVEATLEPRSAKVIWVHTGAEPIALRGSKLSKGPQYDEDLGLTENAAKRIV